MQKSIPRSLLSLVLGVGLLGSGAIGFISPIAIAGPQMRVQPDAESAFLQRWVGEWEGTGTSEGKAVRDRMMVQWTLDRRFLRFTYKALSGDNYEGEGYFWYNPQVKRYEWWEFNNGKWPVRQHIGDRDKEQLILEEDAGDHKMRLIFTFKDDNTLEMTEGYIKGDQFQPYVVMQFHRKVERSTSRNYHHSLCP